ncbi:cation-translocating P-type ATPase [Bradyrhizobium sp. AUGA SZCCT0177]|uniref:cation-translocating P-type ATPase n=1 Tax=Bradyrhizobium sp. AUGA SZCCT0177 TaxID=2807665 RepID=UPI001BABE949|nr:cation-translocating P-type ATPase [Bradyrhizobium sp. AUGA SZCCT0177]
MRYFPESRAPLSGLSEAEARARLKAEGNNELPQPNRRTPLRIAIEVLREPMLMLLIAGGGVYLALGDLTEAIILVAFATMSVVITVVQEARTERVLEALRDLTSPRALVIRDGERKRIAGRDVVRGDLIVLSEGDRVPADAVLLQCQDLQADESMLTGESVPVRKIARTDRGRIETHPPGGDDLPEVFSGSLVVRGAGLAVVAATGVRSEIGKIGQSLVALETEPPRLQAQTRRLVRLFAVVGGAVSILAVLLYGIMRGGWLDAVLAGIALGMSMLPEELPVVLTVFMAMGAWRISQARVLTRRAAAIEALGSATVLCTDKTGTLTENRMTIVELRLGDGGAWRPHDGTKIPEQFQTLSEFGLLASAPEPFDPMERAFHALGREQLDDMQYSHPHWKLVHAYGLRPDLLAVTHIWQPDNSGQEFIVAAKGAPEAIGRLCRLGEADSAALKQSIDDMASAGLRVLGAARAKYVGPEWPASPCQFTFEFLGLVGLADPLRPSVIEAMRECRSAGIKAVMITGDYPATANAIARQAGFKPGEVITGEELAKLDDAEVARRTKTTSVFARITPEQKLRIVNAHKGNGEIVAMTGDGVNDAPSLKAAHIGIAMGGRGTDVAREASAIVLLDDDFGSIVKAIRLGRRIYDNLRKAMSFIFAVHVPIAGLALLPLLFGLPILFGPIHIAFLEMVIDPVCSLVFEAETEEDDIMERPPRAADTPLFSGALIVWSLLQGVVAFALVAAIFVVALRSGMPEQEVRALTFFSLVVTIVSLILVNRSFSASLLTALRRPNRTLVAVLAAVTTILSLTLLWPSAGKLFAFGPLHTDDLALTLGAGIIVLVCLEMLKPLLRSRLQS